jgi:hypothetical protein
MDFSPLRVTQRVFSCPFDYVALHVDSSEVWLHDSPTKSTPKSGTREDRETRIGVDCGFFLFGLETGKKNPPE